MVLSGCWLSGRVRRQIAGMIGNQPCTWSNTNENQPTNISHLDHFILRSSPLSRTELRSGNVIFNTALLSNKLLDSPARRYAIEVTSYLKGKMQSLLLLERTLKSIWIHYRHGRLIKMACKSNCKADLYLVQLVQLEIARGAFLEATGEKGTWMTTQGSNWRSRLGRGSNSWKSGSLEPHVLRYINCHE
jgi:hypothetical protein